MEKRKREYCSENVWLSSLKHHSVILMTASMLPKYYCLLTIWVVCYLYMPDWTFHSPYRGWHNYWHKVCWEQPTNKLGHECRGGRADNCCSVCLFAKSPKCMTMSSLSSLRYPDQLLCSHKLLLETGGICGLILLGSSTATRWQLAAMAAQGTDVSSTCTASDNHHCWQCDGVGIGMFSIFFILLSHYQYYLIKVWPSICP